MAALIRPCRLTDAKDVVELIERILHEYGFSALLVGGIGSIEGDLRASYDHPDSVRAQFWVAEMKDQIVGSVAIRPKQGLQCELKRLYLRSDMRGFGLGQKLYAEAEAFARVAGYERIWADSSRRFTRAARLYERNGFVLVEQLDNVWEDAVYEKKLN